MPRDPFAQPFDQITNCRLVYVQATNLYLKWKFDINYFDRWFWNKWLKDIKHQNNIILDKKYTRKERNINIQTLIHPNIDIRCSRILIFKLDEILLQYGTVLLKRLENITSRPASNIMIKELNFVCSFVCYHRFSIKFRKVESLNIIYNEQQRFVSSICPWAQPFFDQIIKDIAFLKLACLVLISEIAEFLHM